MSGNKVKPLPFSAAEIWLNTCTACGCNNPSGPKETPPRCAGCGCKLEPFRDSGEGWGTWQHEERRVLMFLDKKARAKLRQDEREDKLRRRMARRLAR